MPDTVYTRPGGETTTDPTWIDRIFNGPSQVGALGHAGLSSIPYFGPAYMAGRGINQLVHWLATLGHGNGQLPTNSETNNPPIYGPAGATYSPGMPTNSQTNNPPMYGPGAIPNWSNVFKAPTALLSSNARNAIGLGTPGFAGGYGGSLDSGTNAYQQYIAAHTQK